MKYFLILICLVSSVACNQNSQPTVTVPPQVKPAAKRYHLTGRVVSTDKRGSSVLIDGDAIPGFMSAMTMPYTVKDLSILDKLTPGDKIAADVVVQGDDSWIENVVVTGHTTPPKPTTQLHIPVAATPYPISLSSTRGLCGSDIPVRRL